MIINNGAGAMPIITTAAASATVVTDVAAGATVGACLPAGQAIQLTPPTPTPSGEYVGAVPPPVYSPAPKPGTREHYVDLLDKALNYLYPIRLSYDFDMPNIRLLKRLFFRTLKEISVRHRNHEKQQEVQNCIQTAIDFCVQDLNENSQLTGEERTVLVNITLISKNSLLAMYELAERFIAGYLLNGQPLYEAAFVHFPNARAMAADSKVDVTPEAFIAGIRENLPPLTAGGRRKFLVIGANVDEIDLIRKEFGSDASITVFEKNEQRAAVLKKAGVIVIPGAFDADKTRLSPQYDALFSNFALTPPEITALSAGAKSGGLVVFQQVAYDEFSEKRVNILAKVGLKIIINQFGRPLFATQVSQAYALGVIALLLKRDSPPSERGLSPLAARPARKKDPPKGEKDRDWRRTRKSPARSLIGSGKK